MKVQGRIFCVAVILSLLFTNMGIVGTEAMAATEAVKTAFEESKPSLDGVVESTAERGKSPTNYYIKINRKANVITVYTRDASGEFTVPIKAITCSTGKKNATPIGCYESMMKYRWHQLNGGVYGQYCFRITDHYLFHSVPYYTQNKTKLKYIEYNKLGTQASGGCVRMTVEDAKWLYDNIPSKTTVEVYESDNPGPLGKPATIKIDVNSRNRGWDPTDPDPANPWRKNSPKISGVVNRNVERGEEFNILEGITAKDYKGKKLEVTTEGIVDTSKCGAYIVTYTAEDASGNKTSMRATIEVVDTTAPELKISGKFTFTDADSSKIREKMLKQIVATDCGQKLEAAQITVNDTDLQKAMKKHEYGKQYVIVYATDLAGNVSFKAIVMVEYKDSIPPELTVRDVEPIYMDVELGETDEEVLERAVGIAEEELLKHAVVCTQFEEKITFSTEFVEASVEYLGRRRLRCVVTMIVIATDDSNNTTKIEKTVYVYT